MAMRCGERWITARRAQRSMGRWMSAQQLFGNGSVTEADVATHVIREVGKAEFHLCSCQADGADHEPHRSLLISEHMLDRGTHGGLRALARRVHGAIARPRGFLR